MSTASYLLISALLASSSYCYSAGQLPLMDGSAEESIGCKNRTAFNSGDNEDPYHTYMQYCGYLRENTPSGHFTYNPPSFAPDWSFPTAVDRLEEFYTKLQSTEITSVEIGLCHYQIQQLICLTLFPVCHEIVDQSEPTVVYGMPCRSSCEQTKDRCEPLLSHLFPTIYQDWPEDIKCDKYDRKDELEESGTTPRSKQLDTCIKYPENIFTPITIDAPSGDNTSEPTNSSFECTDYVTPCSALVRTSVSRKAFCNKKFEFAIKGKISEFSSHNTTGKKTLRVTIEKDFHLSSHVQQYQEGDEVILTTDADYDSCCLQLSTSESYLLMGNIESNNEWKLRTSNEKEEAKGGCVASLWNEEKYSKIDSGRNPWLDC